jgi:hypothetical protein
VSPAQVTLASASGSAAGTTAINASATGLLVSANVAASTGSGSASASTSTAAASLGVLSSAGQAAGTAGAIGSLGQITATAATGAVLSPPPQQSGASVSARKPRRRPAWVDPSPLYGQLDTEEEEALILAGAI